tara:strand:- start:118929 stop:119969 length:1041 start_codon:yes stop_codon:yes gene_type:complete
MKTIFMYLSLLLFSAIYFQAQAQETSVSEKLILLEDQRETIVTEEKEALKVKVEQINSRYENSEISSEEAETLKNEAAQFHALNIENRVAIVENKIALLERNNEEALEEDDSYVALFGDGKVIRLKFNKERKYDRRTTSDFVFAFGLNNVVTEGETLNDSEFKVGGSRFAELGWAWKTRVFENSNWLRLKYGFSFQFNGLKPIDNQIFVDTGEETVLEEFPVNLDKSKFRMDNLVFPVHFELGPSKKIEKEDYFRYSTRNYIKVGLGGYAGFNLGTRQKLKYEEDGERVKEKLKGGYNTNNFIYGLSGYIGWRNTALYIKYDLNTIFKDNPVEQHNVSLGLRFDVD